MHKAVYQNHADGVSIDVFADDPRIGNGVTIQFHRKGLNPLNDFFERSEDVSVCWDKSRLRTVRSDKWNEQEIKTYLQRALDGTKADFNEIYSDMEKSYNAM